MNTQFTVGVVGNPNCGKTTLFNVLTGSKQQVGNWPGVTVEKKTGHYQHRHIQIQLVDLPGTYSLESDDDSVSLDEKIARDYVASRQADLIINIVDASNIERNLYLTSQLMEMRVPMILVLNMIDAVKKRGIRIDTALLAQKLGCPVLAISAATGQGLDVLRDSINHACVKAPLPILNVNYHPEIERAVTVLQASLQDCDYDSRWLALRLLENDTLARQLSLPKFVTASRSGRKT